MKRLLIPALGLIGLVGCDAVIGLGRPRTTAVRLVNDGDFDVDVTLYISDDQDTIEQILTEFGTRLEYTVPAGEAVSFSRDCDWLQAIVIDNAELMLIGQLGPEANSEVLRDGSDFFCGDTIVFTFRHSAAIIDFDVSVSVQ